MSFSALEAARQQPDADALVLDDGATWTYFQLGERVRAAMDAIEAALPGPRVEDPRGGPARTSPGLALPSGVPRVALVARPEPETIATLLALVELGLPAILLHPAAPTSERASQAAATGAALVLDGSASTAVPATPARTLASDASVAGGAASTWRQGAVARDGPPVDAPGQPPPGERCLALLFTSGTSGAPRAVVLSHRAFAFAAAASHRNLPLSVGDRWLLALPFAHVGGLSVILRCVRARAAVVLAPPRSTGDRVAELAAAIERQRVTLASLVPTQLHRLLALAPPWRAPQALRAILLGGSAAAPALLARADDRGLPILTTYGLTETCAQVATLPPGGRHRGELGCGPPLPGVAVRITAAGAIAVKAPSLLSGYLEQGALRPPPLDDGFLVTGDAGRLDEAGHLHVLGRLDDVIVTGGEKVHPLEVEAALAEAPGVAAACVFALDDPEWGQRVAVAVVAVPGEAVEPAALHQALAPLAPWKRPRSLALVDALPLTASGKPDRRATAVAFTSRLRPLPAG